MGTIEQDGEVKIIVRLTVLDDESNANNEDVISDVEIWMTKGGCVAELKAILESQDLLPGETDNKLIDGQPSFVIEVRLPSTSALLQDDDNIPEEATTVDVVVRHPGKGEKRLKFLLLIYPKNNLVLVMIGRSRAFVPLGFTRFQKYIDCFQFNHCPIGS